MTQRRGWDWMLARINRAARRQSAVGSRQSKARIVEPTAEARLTTAEQRLVEVAPHRFVNQKALQRLEKTP